MREDTHHSIGSIRQHQRSRPAGIFNPVLVVLFNAGLTASLFESSLNPCCYLDSASDFEGEQRLHRGKSERAKRQNRGKIYIRHKFCLGPSQELENTVTFFSSQAGVDSRFALPVPQFFEMFNCNSLFEYYRWFPEFFLNRTPCHQVAYC